MPIRPEMKTLYPKNWREIVAAIRARSGGRCECKGECGLHRSRRCTETHGSMAKFARGRIILTTAHLNHDPTVNDPENLRAMCQRCHLVYDRDHHSETARKTRDRRSGQGYLWIEPVDVPGQKVSVEA